MEREHAERRDVDGRLIERVAIGETARRHRLEPHPEGGWFRRTWASDVPVVEPGRTRPSATAILFLLPVGESSAWHKVTSDELWIWHGPGPVTLQLGGGGDAPVPPEPSASIGTLTLSLEQPQHLVPAGIWQRTLPADVEALTTCVVSPGFDFADFTLAQD